MRFVGFLRGVANEKKGLAAAQSTDFFVVSNRRERKNKSAESAQNAAARALEESRKVLLGSVALEPSTDAERKRAVARANNLIRQSKSVHGGKMRLLQWGEVRAEMKRRLREKYPPPRAASQRAQFQSSPDKSVQQTRLLVCHQLRPPSSTACN